MFTGVDEVHETVQVDSLREILETEGERYILYEKVAMHVCAIVQAGN
jgi:hypothetical protein